MSDRIIQFINETLRSSPEGTQFEVLERAVAVKLGHPVARGSLRKLLVRNANLFVEDAGGRWRLRVHTETVEPEDGEPVAGQPTRQPLRRGRFVVFDLETLGREADGENIEIIEIAFARYEDGRRVEAWQTFVRPSASIPQLITELTTITDDDVSEAPGQREALEEFFRRTTGYPLIAHNGFAFDGVVLRNVASRVGVEVPADLLILDTLPLARLFLQGAGQRHNNEALAEHYGSFRTGAHRADADVEMLCGTVEGLIGETNKHPAGTLIYGLLIRSGDPWGDLLDPPQASLDLEATLALFGGAQKQLLPTPDERRRARGSALVHGAEEESISALFEEMARTGREAERLAGLLRGRNIAAQPYHPGLPTPTRHNIQELFMQGEIQVVVATNAFGMGVDKQEIRFVLHYDHPSSVEAYVQESGRAGRDGREAYAILLYSKRTQSTHRFLARQGVPNPDEIIEVASRILDPEFDGALKQPDGTIYTSMESLVEELGFEDSKLRVIIHALEGNGILKRGEDFALEATVLLNRPAAEIAQGLSQENLALFKALSETFDFAVDMRSYYRSLSFVRETKHAPSLVDRLLHRLALKGDLIYRSFARGSSFTPGERASDSRSVREAAGGFQDRLAQFSSRLKDIIRYAELGADQGLCRAKFLVDYLTSEGDSPSVSQATERCGKCDLCAPGYPLPWSQTAVIAPEPLQIEPTMAVLEVVRDHEARSSINTLIKILLGEMFGTAGGQRYSLSAYARNSEHFGTLRGKSSHEKLKNYFDSLVGGAYLSVVERQRSDGGTYKAVRLTDRGRDVLAGAIPAPGNEEPITVEDAT